MPVIPQVQRAVHHCHTPKDDREDRRRDPPDRAPKVPGWFSAFEIAVNDAGGRGQPVPHVPWKEKVIHPMGLGGQQEHIEEEDGDHESQRDDRHESNQQHRANDEGRPQRDATVKRQQNPSERYAASDDRAESKQHGEVEEIRAKDYAEPNVFRA